MSRATYVSPLTAESNGRMLTVEQVAEMFGVSGRTVRRRIASGELPSYRYGRMIRVRYKDVCELWAYRETLARPGRMVVS